MSFALRTEISFIRGGLGFVGDQLMPVLIDAKKNISLPSVRDMESHIS